MKLSFSQNSEHLKKRLSCLRYLLTHQVNVGLTSSASDRSRFLLAIHTHGAPVMHIPPRPVVAPALADEEVRQSMAAALNEACESALSGDLAGTQSGLEEAGRLGAEGIRAYIDRGIPPPNSPVTLNGGWIYNPVARKGVYVRCKNGDTPLKDTGALYRDFDFEITER